MPLDASPASSHRLQATARTLLRARGKLSASKRRKRAASADINKKNRFNSWAGADLAPDQVAFGAAMAKYLAGRGRRTWTCGEVLDVLLDLGYRNPERDFEVCVHRFALAVKRFKRAARRRFPTWCEVLRVAVQCGWYRRA